MCVALLYSVCVCVRVRQTLLLVAFHVGLCFVLTLDKQIHRETLCTPEGLISPLWKAVVGSEIRLLCKKTSRLLSLVIPEGVQQWQAGPARGQLCAQAGCGVSWPGGKGWHANLMAQL